MDAIGSSQNTGELAAFVTCEACGGPVIMKDTGRRRVHAYCDKSGLQKGSGCGPGARLTRWQAVAAA